MIVDSPISSNRAAVKGASFFDQLHILEGSSEPDHRLNSVRIPFYPGAKSRRRVAIRERNPHDLIVDHLLDFHDQILPDQSDQPLYYIAPKEPGYPDNSRRHPAPKNKTGSLQCWVKMDFR